MSPRALAALLSLALAGCGSGAESPVSPTEETGECATSGQVGFVRDTLREMYFWYSELPDPDPASFASPEAYLEAVRFRPLDASYSYITTKAASDAFFSDSQFIGLGIAYLQTGDAELRVAQVFPDGSAAEAGLRRGDYLVEVGGRSVVELLQTGGLGAAFGPDEVGVTVALAWRTPSGERQAAVLAKRLVTIPTVSATAVFDVAGARVGYVFFRNFVRPSHEALDSAFAELAGQGVTDLVLDLRYNGGGLVDVAQHLASLIGGSGTAGEVFLAFRHNDKNAHRDTSLLFEDRVGALDLPRLVVIQAGGSASASEAVVNGLRPFMPVTTVGDRSFGKPVGQYGFEFCEKVLYPVAFVVANARDEADYFDGIAADCPAVDDLDRPIADPDEGSLAAALFFLRTGRCRAAAAGEAELRARRRAAGKPFAGDPWRQLVGAY